MHHHRSRSVSAFPARGVGRPFLVALARPSHATKNGRATGPAALCALPLVLALLMGAATAQPPTAPANWLADPSFERAVAAGAALTAFRGPAGWKVASNQPQAYETTLSGQVVRTGRYSVRVSGRGQWSVWISPAVPCQPDQEYLAAAWVTVEGQGATAAVKLDFLDAEGKWLASSEATKVRGSRGWTRIAARASRGKVAGAERAAQVALAMALEGSGTVWFDDLVFRAAQEKE